MEANLTWRQVGVRLVVNGGYGEPPINVFALLLYNVLVLAIMMRNWLSFEVEKSKRMRC